MKFRKTLAIFVILVIGFGITGAATATTFNSEINNGLKIWFEPIIGWYKEPITGEVSISTDKGSYYYGEPVHITIENEGDKEAYYCGSYNHWIIEQYKNGEWNRIYPTIEICVLSNDFISPGAEEKDTWDADVSAGDYRVTVSYYVEEPKYIFTEYCYFSVYSLYHMPIIDTEEVKPIIIGVEKLPSRISISNDHVKLQKLPDPIIIPIDDILEYEVTKLPPIEIAKIDLSQHIVKNNDNLICKYTTENIESVKINIVDAVKISNNLN